MNDNTNYTPFTNDNLLGISNKDILNEKEALGIANAELFIFELDDQIEISTQLVLQIHKIAFGELYEWAGKWRTIEVVVGQLIPTLSNQILQSMYQYLDNLNYKIGISNTKSEHILTLIYVHCEFVKIHPFVNGNGRSGRLIMNLVALKFGYKPIELYAKDGNSRKIYISAMQQSDENEFTILTDLIAKELVSF